MFKKELFGKKALVAGLVLTIALSMAGCKKAEPTDTTGQATNESTMTDAVAPTDAPSTDATVTAATVTPVEITEATITPAASDTVIVTPDAAATATVTPKAGTATPKAGTTPKAATTTPKAATATPKAGATSTPKPATTVTGPFTASWTKATNVKIDGSLSDWSSAKWESLLPSEKTCFGLVITEASDCSADFAFQWDNTYLYMAVKGKDDVVFLNTKQDATLWNGDCIEVNFSTNPANSGVGQNMYSATDFKFMVGKGTKGEQVIIPGFQGVETRILEAKDYQLTMKDVDGKSYIVELRLPWSLFGSYAPKSGDLLGFNFAVGDNDEAAKRKDQLVWKLDIDSEGKNQFQYPNMWGRALLK